MVGGEGDYEQYGQEMELTPEDVMRQRIAQIEEVVQD